MGGAIFTVGVQIWGEPAEQATMDDQRAKSSKNPPQASMQNLHLVSIDVSRYSLAPLYHWSNPRLLFYPCSFPLLGFS